MKSWFRIPIVGLRNVSTISCIQTSQTASLARLLPKFSRVVTYRIVSSVKTQLPEPFTKHFERVNVNTAYRSQSKPRFASYLGNHEARRSLCLWDFYFDRNMTLRETMVLISPMLFALVLGVWCQTYMSDILAEYSDEDGEDEEDDNDDGDHNEYDDDEEEYKEDDEE